MTRTGWRARAARRLAPLVLALAVAGTTLASGWTVQTIALRDLREAKATADDLRGFGLDAYTEFAMWRGAQFVRVRFGCFRTREAAEAMAARVRNALVAEAVAVERTPDAPSQGCVEERTGFLKPEAWRQVADGLPAFEVTMAGTTAVVRHTGRRWRISQEDEAWPEAAPASPPRFRQGDLLGVPVVQALRGGRALVVCPGRLLAEIGDVAVVDRDDRIVACHVHAPTARVEAD